MVMTSSATTTSDALVSAAQRGDRQALQQLLQTEQQRIYAFGLKMCRHPEDAKDILQETMLAIAQGIGGFRAEASLSTWMFQIARSFCIKKRRLRKGAPKASETIDEAEALADSAPDPEQTTRSKELEAILNEALAQLPQASREVLVLRDVEGLTAPEVAAVLGVSVDAVKSKLHRARAHLHKVVGAKFGGDLSDTSLRDCPDILALYSKQLEGDLTPGFCSEMETHVAQCKRCHSNCEALKQSLALCRTWPVVPNHVQTAVRQSLASVLSPRG